MQFMFQGATYKMWCKWYNATENYKNPSNSRIENGKDFIFFKWIDTVQASVYIWFFCFSIAINCNFSENQDIRKNQDIVVICV